MNILKITVCAISLGIVNVFFCCAQTIAPKDPEFVIVPSKQQRKRSIQELKEDLGAITKKNFECTTQLGANIANLQCSFADFLSREMKEKKQDHKYATTLNSTSIFNRSLGCLQRELVVMQQRCSHVVEKLVEDAAPFKKASKHVLKKAYQTLHATQQRLNGINSNLTMVAATFKKADISLESIAQQVQAQANILQKINTCFNKDECLKSI